MPPIAPAGRRMRLLPSCAAALSRAEQRRIGERADRDHQAVDAAAQHLLAMLGHRLLAGDLGHDRGRRASSSSSASTMSMPAERCARLHRRGRHARARRRSARRSSGLAAQRRDHVLRDAAAADEPDRGHCECSARWSANGAASSVRPLPRLRGRVGEGVKEHGVCAPSLSLPRKRGRGRCGASLRNRVRATAGRSHCANRMPVNFHCDSSSMA